MKIEDIKLDEFYNIRARAFYNLDNNSITFKLPTGCMFVVGAKDIEAVCSPLTPASGEQNNLTPTGGEQKPKYDPCREFRAGDKVELKTNLGRNPYDTFDGQEYIPDGTVFTVLRDEWADGKVDIFEKDESDAFTVHFSNLELVTPVDEFEPFYIIDDEYDAEHPFFVIQNRKSQLSSGLDEEVMRFLYGQNYTADKETVRKRAEAERDRLNAEYRKEMEM